MDPDACIASRLFMEKAFPLMVVEVGHSQAYNNLLDKAPLLLRHMSTPQTGPAALLKAIYSVLYAFSIAHSSARPF